LGGHGQYRPWRFERSITPLAIHNSNHLRIGYLVNQYPKISHTFIRTEIEAVEATGIEVHRYSIRESPDKLIDPADQREQKQTRVLLRGGVVEQLTGFLQAGLKPAAFARTLATAVRMGTRSERGIARHLAYLAEACILRQWAMESGLQHIHAHFGTNSATVAMLCRMLGGPSYSFTVHGPEEFDKASLISLPLKIEKAAFIAAVSDFGRAQVWRYTSPAEWNKVNVVRCGVDRRFFETIDRTFPAARRLVCVGRLCEQKGQLVLLHAASELKASGATFELVLVGDGELRPVLEAAIDDMQLRDTVRITGWQTPEQVRAHVENSRALVLPSFAEGLPVVIMESLALHRPVISTYVAGIPELVIPAENGWLVAAGSKTQLVQAMREALDASPGRLAEMGLAGHARVRSQHDADENARKLCELITRPKQERR
jgi:colanic acid/amylovoran biosynthesis glycosyltransferase